MGARILPLQESEAPDDVKRTYQEIKSNFGMVPNLFKTIAHKPNALSTLYSFALALSLDNSLPAKIKELAILTTSKTNRCHYCISHHTEMGKKVGLTIEQIEAISEYKDSNLFTQEEKTVIQYAQQVTKDAENVSDELFLRLKGFYSDEQIVLLTLIIGLYQIFNKFNGALGVQLEK
jgi:uncharacterized peroxidase-related enzyme